MSKVRAIAFVCFMTSMGVLSTVNTQAKSVPHCSEQETCGEFEGCTGACGCTCSGLFAWPFGCYGGPPPSTYSDGYCAILYSTE